MIFLCEECVVEILIVKKFIFVAILTRMLNVSDHCNGTKKEQTSASVNILGLILFGVETWLS